MSARSIRRSHARRLRRAATAAGVAVSGSAALASGAEAANFPVTNTADLGAGSLRNAVNSANAAGGLDTISFTGAGASGEITLSTEISITDDLTINGPGAGALSVSGDGNNNNVRDFATSNVAQGDTRIFRVSDSTSPGSPLQRVAISGLTLKEGVADRFTAGTPYRESGGAVYAEDTALTLSGVTMVDNVATQDGGAVYLTNGGLGGGNYAALNVSGSLFTNNRALDGGGAISSLPTKYTSSDGNDDTTITDSQITGNRAGGTNFGAFGSSSTPRGGGLHAQYEVNLTGVTISGNTALTDTAGTVDGFAGGARLQDGTVRDSVITGNLSGGGAGGLSLRGTRVSNTTVSGNTAAGGGGGGIVADQGGGKYSSDGPSRLDNSTVSGNSALGTGPYDGLGGGIWAYGSGVAEGLVVRNSTIASNTASVGAGGIGALTSYEPEEPAVRLRSTIVGDNQAPGGDLASRKESAAGPVPAGDNFLVGFSLIESPGGAGLIGDPTASNLLGVDPGLAPLAANGGPTQTHALAPTSPAVDAGQGNGFSTDQRGQPRTLDAAATNNPLSDGTDIGAFELGDLAASGDDPDTKFKKKPKKKLKLREGKKAAKVKLKFTGTDNAPPVGPLTFECKVDKGAFEECKSPLKLQLDKGKHTVEVRAIDADGQVDATPVKAGIKVKAAKKEK